MIEYRDEFANFNDHNALKDILELLGGKIYIKTYLNFTKTNWVDFENDYLDVRDLSYYYINHSLTPFTHSA